MPYIWFYSPGMLYAKIGIALLAAGMALALCLVVKVRRQPGETGNRPVIIEPLETEIIVPGRDSTELLSSPTEFLSYNTEVLPGAQETEVLHDATEILTGDTQQLSPEQQTRAF